MSKLLTLFANTRFRPSKLSGLALWFDARDGNTIALSGSDVVTQWSDKSGNGNHALPASGARQPKYVAAAINGRPAVQGRHDGTNASQLDIADSASLHYTQFTAFTVAQRVLDMAATETLAGKYNTTGNQREFTQTVSSGDNLATTASPDGTSTGLVNATVVNPIATGTPIIGISSYDGATLKSELVGVAPVTGSIGSVFNGTSIYTLFARAGAADPFAGYIGEHLFFTRNLTDAERALVVAYLKTRWGIA
jgi:hypothetical protein